MLALCDALKGLNKSVAIFGSDRSVLSSSGPDLRCPTAPVGAEQPLPVPLRFGGNYYRSVPIISGSAWSYVSSSGIAGQSLVIS